MFLFLSRHFPPSVVLDPDFQTRKKTQRIIITIYGEQNPGTCNCETKLSYKVLRQCLIIRHKRVCAVFTTTDMHKDKKKLTLSVYNSVKNVMKVRTTSVHQTSISNNTAVGRVSQQSILFISQLHKRVLFCDNSQSQTLIHQAQQLKKKREKPKSTNMSHWVETSAGDREKMQQSCELASFECFKRISVY